MPELTLSPPPILAFAIIIFQAETSQRNAFSVLELEGNQISSSDTWRSKLKFADAHLRFPLLENEQEAFRLNIPRIPIQILDLESGRENLSGEKKLPETCPCPSQDQETARRGKDTDFYSSLRNLLLVREFLEHLQGENPPIPRPILRLQSNCDSTESWNFPGTSRKPEQSRITPVEKRNEAKSASSLSPKLGRNSSRGEKGKWILQQWCCDLRTRRYITNNESLLSYW